jgi:hypothetical protein
MSSSLADVHPNLVGLVPTSPPTSGRTVISIFADSPGTGRKIWDDKAALFHAMAGGAAALS